MAESLDELREYRLKVVAELERRMLKLQEIDGRIENIRLLTDSFLQTRPLLIGSTARSQVEAAHKSRLKESFKELEGERVQAAIDLERAEERLKEVDERIAAFNGEQA